MKDNTLIPPCADFHSLSSKAVSEDPTFSCANSSSASGFGFTPLEDQALLGLCSWSWTTSFLPLFPKTLHETLPSSFSWKTRLCRSIMLINAQNLWVALRYLTSDWAQLALLQEKHEISNMHIPFLFLSWPENMFVCLFIDSKERGRDREININVREKPQSLASCMLPDGWDQICNLGMCSDWNQTCGPLVHETMLQSLSHTTQSPCIFFFLASNRKHLIASWQPGPSIPSWFSHSCPQRSYEIMWSKYT